jgi:hypothetical protein
MKMKLIVAGAAALVLLNGCAVQRAEVAHNAQVQMVGLSKEKVLACMGVPANKMTVGATEVWAYSSGNGETVGSVFGSGGNGFFSCLGVSTQRFCNVSIVMTNDVVSHVNYSVRQADFCLPADAHLRGRIALNHDA